MGWTRASVRTPPLMHALRPCAYAHRARGQWVQMWTEMRGHSRCLGPWDQVVQKRRSKKGKLPLTGELGSRCQAGAGAAR